MIAKTSVISFVIVLLAVASYSAPIDKQPDSSQPNLINAKDRPVVVDSVCHSLIPLRIIAAFFSSRNPAVNQLNTKINHRKIVMK